MIADYFMVFYLENFVSKFPQVYRIFDECFSQKTVWLCFTFIFIMTTSFEKMYHTWDHFSEKFYGSKKAEMIEKD